jgi:serine/threonine protein phosphatase 1
MSKSHETCILSDGRTVKFLLQRRDGRDPFYNVRFVGPVKNRVERSTKCANLKAARDVACRIIREEYSPETTFAVISWDDAIARMTAAMEAQNLRERSIREYLAAIRTLRKVYPTLPGPTAITEALAKQFKVVRQQKELNLSPRTVAGNIDNLSIIWAKWFRDELRILDKNPWDAVELPKQDKLTPRLIEPEEERAFFAWLSQRWNGWRLPVLFLEVKGLIGCRVHELCAVKSADFRDGRLTFTAMTTKGRKSRKAKLPEPICRELEALAGPVYLWERHSDQLRDFHRKKGNPNHAKSVKEFTPERLMRFLQREVSDYFDAHPDLRPFTLHDFRRMAMSTAKMAGVSYDDAAITFGCHPETMRQHYLVLDEVAIADSVLDRVQRAKGVESTENSTGQGPKCTNGQVHENASMKSGRIIAIGDIHGCSVALSALIQAIDPAPEDTVVFLGDYIDRGPDSRGVLDQVIALAERCSVVPLLGNHEEMLLAALEGPSEVRFWLKFGGMEALASYGYRSGQEPRPADLPTLIPAGHLEFIRKCRDFFEMPSHIFVHAYYDPDRPLHEQSKEGMRWASLPCIPKPHSSGKVAIVGHSEQRTGEILDLGFLKCIDTCCQGGGWLTALDVGNGKVWQANTAGQMRRGVSELST